MWTPLSQTWQGWKWEYQWGHTVVLAYSRYPNMHPQAICSEAGHFSHMNRHVCATRRQFWETACLQPGVPSLQHGSVRIQEVCMQACRGHHRAIHMLVLGRSNRQAQTPCSGTSIQQACKQAHPGCLAATMKHGRCIKRHA